MSSRKSSASGSGSSKSSGSSASGSGSSASGSSSSGSGSSASGSNSRGSSASSSHSSGSSGSGTHCSGSKSDRELEHIANTGGNTNQTDSVSSSSSSFIQSSSYSPASSSSTKCIHSKIGFVGAGKVAESIINGLVIFGKMDPTRIHVSAPSSNNTDRLKTNHPGLKVTKRNLDIFGKFDCDVIFIAVSGNVMRNLYKLGGIRPAPLTTHYIPNKKHKFYVLSLVTGYDLKSIKDVLVDPEDPDKCDLEIHRIVMNCGAGYGIGICAIDCDPDDSAKLGQPVRSLLSMVAKLEYIPEKEMDAASAVCGAGLAFSYYFINAMSDGALKIGMGRAEAIKFVAKSVNCATQTLLKSRKHPNELKDEVCALLGCGTYGLTILDKADVASGVSGAVEAAHKRAMSLAKEDNPA